jgi:protein gp37
MLHRLVSNSPAFPSVAEIILPDLQWLLDLISDVGGSEGHKINVQKFKYIYEYCTKHSEDELFKKYYVTTSQI